MAEEYGGKSAFFPVDAKPVVSGVRRNMLRTIARRRTSSPVKRFGRALFLSLRVSPFCRRGVHLVKLVVTLAIIGISVSLPLPTSYAVEYTITRQSALVPGESEPTPYLLMTTPVSPANGKHPLIVYLYGRGGSIDNYNLAGAAYAEIRQLAAERGYDILVPELGTDHWMNDHAQHTLDAIIADAGAKNQVDLNVVHMMGTSMGGGSALAYAIHRPDLVRSVSSLLGISDFAQWVGENPNYLGSVSAAYGGSPTAVPEAWHKTSAMENLDTFKSIPVFLVHGMADTVVPPSQSRQLAAALGAKGYEATLREAQGLGHDDAAVTPFQHEIIDFLDTVTAKTTPEPSAIALLTTGLLAVLAFVWSRRWQN